MKQSQRPKTLDSNFVVVIYVAFMKNFDFVDSNSKTQSGSFRPPEPEKP